jgi:o-succinylbenzoate---CoA ligase
LHAVLVARDQPVLRLTELLAAALDGSGPAILPLSGDLPRTRLDELIATFRPGTITDTGGATTARSGQKGVSGDTAVIICTSGSTGAPKGVELSALALTHSARASLARIGARPGERWLCCLPVTHVAGLQVLVRSMLGGTEPMVAGGSDLQTIARAGGGAGEGEGGAGGGCAHVSLVPTQLARLLDAGTPPAGYRTVLLGGAAAAGGLLRRAREQGVRVVTTYGMTETCGGCVYDGFPLDGVKAEIRDEGRIWLGGPVLFRGYHGEPPRSGTWFQTSDLGSLDRTGRLTVRGRADDVINTGGHKVLPGEVAEVLQSCPGVKDAVVIGQRDAEWGETVIAVVVPADPRDPPTLKMLRMRVQERLPRYAAPSRVVLVDAVPMLPSGKPDLQRLRQYLLRS